MRTYGIGFDFGNSHATAALFSAPSVPPTILTIPSMSAPGSIRDYAAMQIGRGQVATVLNPYDLLQDGDYAFSYNEGAERFVGNLALRQTRRPSTGRGDIHRYWSPRSLELLLVLAGSLIPDDRFSLLVVTGLPVETFKSEDARAKVKKALNGSHPFTLNGRSRVADVKVGKVLMEGAGAALAFNIPKDKTCGIIDIGEFTTDVYATRGLEAIIYQCGGAEIGMANAADRLNTLFQRDYHRALKPEERIAILRAHLSPQRPHAYPSLATEMGEADPLRIDAWCVQALREMGHDVREYVSSLWRVGSEGQVAADFTRVQVIGGGAYYLLDEIRQVIRKANRSADPENDNARGYGWFASQLLAQRSVA